VTLNLILILNLILNPILIWILILTCLNQHRTEGVCALQGCAAGGRLLLPLSLPAVAAAAEGP
jgi:hypothetical protein